MNTKPPITAADVSDKWVQDCREAMSVREGVPIAANPSVPSIDAYSIGRKAWIPIMLPGSGTTFVSFEDRNKVLARLTEKRAPGVRVPV